MPIKTSFWKTRPGIVQLQILIWVSVFLLTFFSMLPMDGVGKSIIYTVVNTSFYAIIIYGNILFLYPVFYEKGRRIAYVMLVILFLTGVGLLRGFIVLTLYNHFILTIPRDTGLLTLSGYIPGGILIFVLSLIFRISIAYFVLRRQNEEMRVQKGQAELNLLKSQVQPHFLFNTLNNIYYEAFREAPRTAALIERLSDIMRYFVDESPKDEVSIQTEVQFIENYIALEKIRVRHDVTVRFDKNYSHEIRIPPMLLMTFVENIFKHGIDKSSTENRVNLSLEQSGKFLIFKTSNNLNESEVPAPSTGFGIINLTKRLTMLYGTDFELVTRKENGIFAAYLKIPLL